LVLVSLIEGLCYHGDNYDYLTYRIPRLLHWWWAHHWYWIDTTTPRMNFSAPGFEWLMAPFLVMFHTDRPFFLINLVSYLLLPGLVFSVFRSFGVTARVAWWSMWVFPAGLCYALEAGGLGNDMFGCVYLFAAFHYAAKGRSGSVVAMALAILAMALLSDAKSSNIPLALPWLVLVAFSWRRFPAEAWGRFALAGAVVVGVAVSAVVIMALNYTFTGDYAGDPTDWERMKMHAPLIGFIGTGVMLLVSNLSPPFLPHDIHWNVLPDGLRQTMALDFPRYLPRSPGLMLEESCSFGIGASFFLLLGCLYGLRALLNREKFAVPTFAKWLALAVGIDWLVFMCKLASDGAPRLVAPYYLLTAAAILAVLPFDGRLTRRPLWRGLAYGTLAIALLVVAVTPGRPLLPPKMVFAILQAVHAPAGVRESWAKNQALRADHFDGLRSLRLAIPASEKSVGLIEGDDVPGTSLWLPFGSRSVVEINPAHDTPAEVQRRGIHYLALGETSLYHHQKMTVKDFAAKWSGTIVESTDFPMKTNQTERWYLVRLN
jgi:hypothetical protein